MDQVLLTAILLHVISQRSNLSDLDALPTTEDLLVVEYELRTSDNDYNIYKLGHTLPQCG